MLIIIIGKIFNQIWNIQCKIDQIDDDLQRLEKSIKKETERQKDRKTNGQRDGEKDRQRDKNTKRHNYRLKRKKKKYYNKRILRLTNNHNLVKKQKIKLILISTGKFFFRSNLNPLLADIPLQWTVWKGRY